MGVGFGLAGQRCWVKLILGRCFLTTRRKDGTPQSPLVWDGRIHLFSTIPCGVPRGVPTGLWLEDSLLIAVLMHLHRLLLLSAEPNTWGGKEGTEEFKLHLREKKILLVAEGKLCHEASGHKAPRREAGRRAEQGDWNAGWAGLERLWKLAGLGWRRS